MAGRTHHVHIYTGFLRCGLACSGGVVVSTDPTCFPVNGTPDGTICESYLVRVLSIHAHAVYSNTRSGTILARPTTRVRAGTEVEDILPAKAQPCPSKPLYPAQYV